MYAQQNTCTNTCANKAKSDVSDLVLQTPGDGGAVGEGGSRGGADETEVVGIMALGRAPRGRYVCVYACMHACVIYMYVCNIYVHVCMCVYACMHACMHV
jgi:hypothetical protein